MGRAAAYQAAYRLRSVVRGEVIAQGWEELDTLLVFRKEDGEVVVVTKDGTRISIADPVESNPTTGVQPLDVPAEEFGPRWQKSRASIAEKVAEFDLTQKGQPYSLALFSNIAALAARGAQLLTEHNGPDWRDALGLDTDKD